MHSNRFRHLSGLLFVYNRNLSTIMLVASHRDGRLMLISCIWREDGSSRLSFSMGSDYCSRSICYDNNKLNSIGRKGWFPGDFPFTIEGVPRIQSIVRDVVTGNELNSYPNQIDAIVLDLPVRQLAYAFCTLYHSTQQEIPR